MGTQSLYDVAIVGASIAGCAAATLLARKGAKVALIERNIAANAYKKVCTHYIQASATPTIERLGIAAAIESAGGIRNEIEVWTRWGWIIPSTHQDPVRPVYGYNIRRETLEPIVRKLATEAPGGEFFPGSTAHALLIDKGRISGVQVDGAKGTRHITARLVIGADGRHSRIAELAGLPVTRKQHGRFAYFAYYRDLPLQRGLRSQMWFLEPDIAYVFPNNDGLTVVAAMPARTKWDAWKSDIEGNMLRLLEKLPKAPTLREANRVSQFLGMTEMPDTIRRAAQPGLALIGDAALAADPLWGVGCGWAFQSAEWLADSVGGSLESPADLDRGLKNYLHHHHRHLAGHEFLIADFANGRSFNLIEKLMLAAAARGPVCADHFFAFGTRCINVRSFLAPSAVARAIWVNFRHLAHIGQTSRRAEAYKAN